jgi:hypothetical protein
VIVKRRAYGTWRWCDASEVICSPIGPGFFSHWDQKINLAGVLIASDLAIPCFPITFRKPLAKFSILLFADH